MAADREDFRQVWSFTAWPAEGRWERSMYELFRLYPRVEMEVTEREFAALVDSLERQGITLREVERQVVSGSLEERDESI